MILKPPIWTWTYDKWDDFDIVNFLFLDKDVPHTASYGVYVSQPLVLQEYVLLLMTT